MQAEVVRRKIKERRRDRPISPERFARENWIRPRLRETCDKFGYPHVAWCLIGYARREKMRSWADTKGPHQRFAGAMSSIRILFSEEAVSTDGRFNTGHCHNWVLDIMEGWLRESIRDHDLFAEHDEVQSSPDENATDGIALAVIDPEDFEAELESLNEPLEGEIEEPMSLSSQILEAFLVRDEDAIMRCAIAVEQLERRNNVLERE